MFDLIKNNRDEMLKFTDDQVKKIQELKDCAECQMLISHIETYKTAIEILLHTEEELNLEIENLKLNEK